MALVSLLIGFNLFADVQFEPTKLSSRKSQWFVTSGKNKRDYYEDIIHEGSVVFRILIRFMPMFNSIVQDAITRKGVLNYRNQGDIFLNSAEDITNNFYITDSLRHLVMTKKPDTILLRKKPGIIWDDYQVIFNDDNSIYEISKEVFENLRKLKTVATSNKLSIRIDLNTMLKFPSDKLSLDNCFWLTEASVSGEMACTVCLNNPKDILMKPCNHLCACSDCAGKISSNCPICARAITAKEKIYW
jgi:hypothetical protein